MASSYSTYMQPFFDSLSQGVQVAQSLRQAAMQQQQLQQAKDEFQQRQALDQQKFNAGQQQDRYNAILGGATPVDSGGNVNVAAPVPQSTPSPFTISSASPDGLPIQAPGLLQNLNFDTGTRANVAADPGRTFQFGSGSPVQAPTPQELFDTRLGQEKQSEQQKNNLALQNALNLRNATFVPLPKKTTDALGLPEGHSVDPKALPEWLNAGTNATKADSDRLNSDLMAREAAATTLAKQNGITLVPGKSAISQLTPELQLQAITQGKEATADPEIKANTLATGASTRATQEMTRQLAAQNLKTGEIKQQNLVDAGAQLNPAGKKALESTEPVLGQIDELRTALEQKNPKDPKGASYKDDNNPLTLAAPLASYRLGFKTSDGELGSKIGDLSLNAIQGAMPFASKSRNYQWLKDIKQHLPSLSGLTPDSPALIYQKLGTVERNFLRMKAGTQKYETVKTSANPANPTLQGGDLQRYYGLAGGDPNAARQMATQDGWTIPQQLPQSQ